MSGICRQTAILLLFAWCRGPVEFSGDPLTGSRALYDSEAILQVKVPVAAVELSLAYQAFDGSIEVSGLPFLGRLSRLRMGSHRATRSLAASSCKGTHRGEFQRIPPTGVQITMPGITILEFRDGSAFGDRQHADSVGLLQQLGALPSR